MPWYNPFSYFTATDEETAQTAQTANNNKESNPLGFILFMLVIVVVAYWFNANCRIVGERRGSDGKMHPIYDCTSKPTMQFYPQQPQMYAAAPVYAAPPMYAAAPAPMYAAAPAPVYAPAPVAVRTGFGRRR